MITDKAVPFRERRDVIKSLAEEIRDAMNGTNVVMVIGHGGGSYPHIPASKYRTHLGLISDQSLEGWAHVQDAAARLNRIVLSALLEAGVRAVSVQPSANVVARKGRIVSWDTFVIEFLLEKGVTPVVYGDVVVDLEQGCSIVSTEELFRFLSHRLRPSRILVAADVDGVYARDPKIDPSGTKLHMINGETFEKMVGSLGAAHAFDVTGGMASKVATLLEISEKTGTECEIIGARRKGTISQAIRGRKGIGTVIKWA